MLTAAPVHLTIEDVRTPRQKPSEYLDFFIKCDRFFLEYFVPMNSGSLQLGLKMAGDISPETS